MTTGYWFLWVRCPACRTINAIDLRTLDRYPDATATSLIPMCPAARAARMRRSLSSIILGNEAAGVVSALGKGVEDIRVSDRVAYCGMGAHFFVNTGAYAQERNVQAERLVKLPGGITDTQAAALMLKGLTASSVVNRVSRPKPGDTILIHAAASGVGLLLVQWAKHFGATVIGTVGNTNKARAAADHGCDHVILYREVDFVPAVKQIVPGGVRAEFDGFGKDTFVKSFDCAASFGVLVNYGNASGHVPPIDILQLSLKGSLSICRVGIGHYLGDPHVPACRRRDGSPAG